MHVSEGGRVWFRVFVSATLLVAAACSGGSNDTPAASTSVPTPTSAGTIPTTAPPPTTTVFDSPVAKAVITGPVTGGGGSIVLAPHPPRAGQPASSLDVTTAGYTEAEYFLSGSATAYTSETPLSSDGMWNVRAAAVAPYVTRVVVRRPTDAAKFNGTVLVEWFNVTGGLDAAPDWTYLQPEILRNGYAYVGVSAQRVGVEGGGLVLGENRVLKVFDPVRYGALVHPGDNFSYDIFSQTGAAVRRDAATLLDGLQPARVLAIGESQSAGRLTTYVNAIAPTARVFDGYFVHSRSGGGAALSADPLPPVAAPFPTSIRADLGVPVLVFSSETDVAGARGYGRARQPDSATFRSWEAAGTAHADSYSLGIGGLDVGDGSIDVRYFATMLAPPAGVYDNLITCATGINTGPQTYILRAALGAMDSWLRTRTPPPSMPRLELDATGNGYVTDDAGNTRGGVRSPQVDVPIAVLGGLGQSGNAFCSLFGSTVPFDAATLKARYGTHEAFVAQFTEAAKRAVAARAIVQVDADHLVAAAAASGVAR